jgi:DNA sulfur modification protein DndC
MEARRFGLDVVLGVQREANAEAARLGRPAIDLVNTEEEARIRELMAANTWPNRWDGGGRGEPAGRVNG